MKKNIIIGLSLCFLFVGCSTKKDVDSPVFYEFQDVVELDVGQTLNVDDYYKVEDASDFDIEYDISKVDTNIAGEYNISIRAKDSYGNTTVKPMKILVMDLSGLYRTSQRTTIYAQPNDSSQVVGTFKEGFLVYAETIHKEEDGYYWITLSNGYVCLDDSMTYEKPLEYKSADFETFEEFASACEIDPGGIGGIFSEGTFTGEVNRTVTCSAWPVIY